MTEHRCSLCGKSNRDKEVTNMAAGPEGFICGECAALAAEAVATSNPEWRDQLIATLTKLRRRK
jgi:ribosome-binding protein aMBF1 (putative translation factor)